MTKDRRAVYVGAAGLGGFLAATDIPFWGAALVLVAYMSITLPWLYLK